MIIAGKPTTIGADKKKVFDYLSNFNHFEKLMPEQIVNWKSDENSCSFVIKGMTSLALKYKSKTPHQTIDIEPDGKSPISFNLRIELEEDALNEQRTTAKVGIDADLNPMMAMLAKKPLENLVNVITDKLNEEFAS